MTRPNRSNAVRNRSVAIVSISLLLSLLLAILSPFRADAATNAAGTLSYNAMQTRLCDMNLTTPHDSGAEDLAMNSSPVQFFPNLYAGIALPLSNRADYGVDLNIMLPHKDDDPTGCSGPMRTMNEYNQTYEGAFILAQQSRCSDLRFRYAGMSGARGLLVYGCSPDFPTNCDPMLQQTLISLTPGNLTMITITYADGIRIRDYLKQKHSESGGLGAPRDTLVATLKSSAPIAPEEKAALLAIMTQTSMGSFAGNPALDLLPYWTVPLFNSSFDPCRDRAKGIWCEGPNIVLINMMYHFWKFNNPAAGIPTQFGAFKELRMFSVLSNIWFGPVPASFCQMTKLKVFWIAQQLVAPGISSVPACEWPEMENFWVEQNSLTSLPISNWTKLKYMSAQLISSHTLPSLKNLPNLEYFDISQNQIVGAGFPEFHPNTKNTLRVVAMGNNQFSGTLTSAAFDGYTALEILDINTNRFTGPLPTLQGCAALKILDLSNQRDLINNTNAGFTGEVPTAWYSSLVKLKTVLLQANSLVMYNGPMSFASLQLLEYLDVSNNFLSLRPLQGFPNGVVSSWMYEVTGPSLTTIRASYNNFSGPFRVPDAAFFMTLRNLYLDHNKIKTAWVEIFTSGVVKYDMSYNDLSPPDSGLFMSGTPTSNFQYLNYQGNPKFTFPTFPKWARPLSISTINVGDSYSCASFKVDSAAELTLLVDPVFYQYKYCTCLAGKFGQAPLCSSLPNNAQLNPFTIISSDEVGSTFPTLLQQTGGVGSNLVVNITEVPSAQVTPNVTAYKQSFSDAMYGENRLTQGLVTSWSIDLTDMYSDDIDQIVAAGNVPPSTQSIYRITKGSGTSPRSTWTPIRVITVRLHISNTLFIDFNDALSVFTGGKDLKGTRVFTLRGTDDKPLKSSSAYTQTAEYQALYGADLAKIDTPSLIEVQVFAPSCAVQFTSRVSGGLHFYATYSYDFQCPQGYFYDKVTDPSSPKCRENYVIYTVSEGLRSAVFAVSALSLAFVLFCIVILLLYWESPVFKAASRVFMLLILVLLLAMTLGAMLYAAIPMLGKTGDAVCSGRAWLTCLPLAGVLAVLLAKNRRLWLIFGATSLQVKVHTDLDLLISVISVCSLQVAMLAIFSGLPISRASLEIGQGSLNDKLVRQCSHETGFMSWIGAEIAFIAALMLPTAYLGFKTRDLPSQYNESFHLQNALVLLMFFGVIIIPLDIFIQDDPGASVLIQGLGQAFLTLVLTAIIFGPKIYYVLSSVNRNAAGGASVHKQTVTHLSGDGAQHSSHGKADSSTPAQSRPTQSGTSKGTHVRHPGGSSLGGPVASVIPSSSRHSAIPPKNGDTSARKAAAFPSAAARGPNASISLAQPSVSVAPMENVRSSSPENVAAADELNAVHRAASPVESGKSIPMDENESPAIEMADVGVTAATE